MGASRDRGEREELYRDYPFHRVVVIVVDLRDAAMTWMRRRLRGEDPGCPRRCLALAPSRRLGSRGSNQ